MFILSSWKIHNVALYSYTSLNYLHDVKINKINQKFISQRQREREGSGWGGWDVQVHMDEWVERKLRHALASSENDWLIDWSY